MRFFESFWRPRLEGFSLFGGSWKLDRAPREEVRRLIVFLGDRRVLTEWDDAEEVYDEVVASVLAIRVRLGEARERLPLQSETSASLDRMQEGCRELLGAAERKGDMNDATGALRTVFADELELLADGLGWKEASDLATVIRAPARGDWREIWL